MLNNKEVTELTGPIIGVDISGFDFDNSEIPEMAPMGRTTGKTQYVAGCGILSDLNGMMSIIGMPSVEELIDEMLGNPNKYRTYVKAITFKGKNRTFKSKVKRKRVLHKDEKLYEYNFSIPNILI